MQPPKFTPMELDSLISEAVRWVNKRREHYLPSSIPLNDDQKERLGPFFPATILDRARVVDFSQTNETIPTLLFTKLFALVATAFSPTPPT